MAIANEAEVSALVADAAGFSRQIWATPATTVEDLRRRAEVAAYYKGGLDQRGKFVLEGLNSKQLDERSVAELIAAVLAFGKQN